MEKREGLSYAELFSAIAKDLRDQRLHTKGYIVEMLASYIADASGHSTIDVLEEALHIAKSIEQEEKDVELHK
jgi:hypothetical protein